MDTFTYILISWFVIGFISMISIWIVDMRGKSYDENYFNEDNVYCSFVVFLLGYISVFVICLTISSEKKFFTKLIYKVANIGSKINR